MSACRATVTVPFLQLSAAASRQLFLPRNEKVVTVTHECCLLGAVVIRALSGCLFIVAIQVITITLLPCYVVCT